MSIAFSVSISHNDTVRHFPLGEQKSTVGRDPSSDIFIGDPAISRQQLTLQRRDEAVRVEMNPKSPNVMVRNGCVQMSGDIAAGECFHVGPYRFEITGTTELPEPHPRGLRADPAGSIDLKVLDDSERIAPRWRSNEARPLETIGIGKSVRSGEAAAPASDEQAGLSPAMRMALLAILALLGAYIAYDFTRPAPPAVAPNRLSFARTDLFAAMNPISCDTPVECLARAADSHRIATQLMRSSAHDLVTRYKVARLLYRAQRALGPDHQQIPDLDAVARQARDELSLIFADTAFLYERALGEGQQKEQRRILQMLMHLCSEDRHAFCPSVEQANRRFADAAP